MHQAKVFEERKYKTVCENVLGSYFNVILFTCSVFIYYGFKIMSQEVLPGCVSC